MAGRKPIDDDRKRKAVTMNVSNKDLKILDNFIRKNGLSSRSYFLYRVVYGYINGNYVKKSNDIVIPNEYDYMQQEFCKKSLKHRPSITSGSLTTCLLSGPSPTFLRTAI